MSVAFTRTVEMEFSAGVWTDITADVLREIPIKISRGLSGTNITDRVAGIGTLDLALNNSAYNSLLKLGLYSPDHANARPGFDNGTPVRLTLSGNSKTKKKFYGRVTHIAAEPGLFGPRGVQVTCGDFMLQTLTHKTTLIPVQVNKTGDELVTTLFAGLPIAPLNTDLDDGPDTFPYALHDVQDESSATMNAIQRVDQSGLSFTFVTGNTADGETLCWRSRHSLLLQSAVATFDNTMTSMQARRSSDEIYNTVKATYFPLNLGTAEEVLWTSREEIPLNTGESRKIEARYTDPSGLGNRVALIPASEVDPLVADTDYKMSSVSGSGGNDLNGNLSISVTWGGNAATIELTNTAAVTGYVQKDHLQLRGKIIRFYDSGTIIRTDAASKLLHGDRVLPINMPYLSNLNVAADFAQEILRRKKNPATQIDSLKFPANKNTTLWDAMMDSDVGDKIVCKETVTGINTDFMICGYELEIYPYQIDCTYTTMETNVSTGEMWLIGVAGYSEIGVNTYFGF